MEELDVQPVTVTEIFDFVQSGTYAFQDTLFLSFTLMVTFALAVGIRRIFVGYKQTA